MCLWLGLCCGPATPLRELTAIPHHIAGTFLGEGKEGEGGLVQLGGRLLPGAEGDGCPCR